MIKPYLTILVSAAVLMLPQHITAQIIKPQAESEACCRDNPGTKNTELACKLTRPELQKRKETVIARMKALILEKKDLENGYAYRFEGSDEILDLLSEFIKTERECCDFFSFAVKARGDKSATWLELTGPEGVKDFIMTGLDF